MLKQVAEKGITISVQIMAYAFGSTISQGSSITTNDLRRKLMRAAIVSGMTEAMIGRALLKSGIKLPEEVESVKDMNKVKQVD